MKKGKKATWLGYGSAIAPFLALIIFFIASVSHADFKARDVPMGYEQLAILKSDIKAQKALLYLDYVGKIAAEQSIYDAAASGGHYESPCGDYFGYSLWQDLVVEDGSMIVKDCSLPDVNEAFNHAMDNNLHSGIMGGYPELGTVSYTSSISQDGIVKSKGDNEMHFSIITELIGLPESAPEKPAEDIIVEGETPVERMFAACSREKLGVEKGIENLKGVTKLWVEEGMDDGAVYVRGGQTKTSMPYECTGAKQSWWIYNHLKNHFPDLELPCVATVNKRTDSECREKLARMYQELVVDKFSGHYMCGDCGTYLVQMYRCAFGRLTLEETHPKYAPVVAATEGAIKGYDSKGKVILNKNVWKTKTTKEDSCWDTVIEPKLGGRLQFGDIIQLPGHWIMYTGGAGLGYDILEMGGWRFPPSNIKEKGDVSVEIGDNGFGSIRTSVSAEKALKVNLAQKKGCIVHRPTKQT